jgi:hypothetical protein
VTNGTVAVSVVTRAGFAWILRDAQARFTAGPSHAGELVRLIGDPACRIVTGEPSSPYP